jgi:hypothetical protein
MFSRNSIGLAAAAAAFILYAGSASAATLNTYYRALITVKTCELEVSEDAMGSLQTAIENKVTETGASSGTINAIFVSLNTEIGGDAASYCSAQSEAALEVINAL